MPISSKTRKILWAKSGGRCAICKAELVGYEQGTTGNVIIGEECHIVSSQPNGPRSGEDLKIGFDDYDNLILLCRIHHKIIDLQVDIFTSAQLLLIKIVHEEQIKRIFDEIAQSPQEAPDIIYRVSSGKELVEIIDSVHGYSFDHEEVESEEEASAIAVFFENMEDHGDLMGMESYSKSRQVHLGLEFSQQLNILEGLGFLVFGERRKREVYFEGNTLPGVWEIAALHVVRKSSPNIINANKAQ